MLGEAPQASYGISTYEKLLEALDEWREPTLHSQLFNHARIIDLKEGEITVNLLEEARPDLIEKLTRILKEKTGKLWVINRASEGGAPTLAEVAQKKEAEVYAEVSEGPLVKAVLESFPGSKIETINER